MEAMVAQCEDKKKRLFIARVVTTDTGKRRKLRQAEVLSKRLLSEAKHAIGNMHLLSARGTSGTCQENSPSAIASTSFVITFLTAGPSVNVPPAAPADLRLTPIEEITPPIADGDDDDGDEEFQDSQENPAPLESPAPQPPAPTEGVSEGIPDARLPDRYDRVHQFMKMEAAHSPNVLFPLTTMLAWCCSVDSHNASILASSLDKVRVLVALPFLSFVATQVIMSFLP
jgi:hypothetical protein